MKIKLNTLTTLLGSAAGAEVQEGWAGGTVTLWAVNAQDRVICLTEGYGPFTPRMTQTGPTVNVNGFAIGVYATEEGYLDGGDPIHPLAEVDTDPDLDALTVALTVACATL